MKAVSVKENQGTLAEATKGEITSMIIAGVQITPITFEQFSAWDFEAPAAYYTRSAMGNYYYYHTKDKAKAQAAADELLGKGLYRVTSSKILSGGKGALTVTGTQTRRGQKR